jgi:hypothetical protein
MGERSEYPPGTFCWIDLATTDGDASKAFYGNLLGWSFEDVPTGEDSVYSLGKLKDREVAGVFAMGEDQAGMPPHWNSYVSVVSTDDAAKRAADLGGTILAEPFDVMQAGRMAVVQDPTGAVVNLWQRIEHHGAELVNEHGTLCWNELMTKDPSSAVAFYASLFDWKTEPFGDNYTLFMNGDRPAGGVMAIDDEQMGPVPPNWSIYIAVDDCDAIHDRVVDAGGQVIMPTETIPEVGRMAVVTDPQGAVFGIIKLDKTPD